MKHLNLKKSCILIYALSIGLISIPMSGHVAPMKFENKDLASFVVKAKNIPYKEQLAENQPTQKEILEKIEALPEPERKESLEALEQMGTLEERQDPEVDEALKRVASEEEAEALKIEETSTGALRAYNLEEVLVRVYNCNPTLAAARAELRAIDENISQALANWRPNVVANASVSRNFTDQRFTAEAEENAALQFVLTGIDGTNFVLTDKKINLEVQQPLYRGGRTVAQTEVAEYQICAGRSQLLNVEQNLFKEAITAYMNVLRDEEVVRLQEKNVEVLKKQLQASRDRFEVGEITKTDVAQSESRLARARADLAQAEGNLINSKSIFERLVGFVPQKLIFPEKHPDLPASVDEARLLAEMHNPQLSLARFNYFAAQKNIDLAFGQLLPELNFVGFIQRDLDPQFSIERADTANLTLNLRIPIYEQGLRQSQVRQNKQTAAQKYQQFYEAKKQIVDDTLRAWESVETFEAQIVAFKKEVETTKIAREGVSQEARVGSRTVLDVLNAEQEVVNAEVNLTKSESDLVSAEYTTVANMGFLTAQKLALPVEYYDYTKYYEYAKYNLFGTGDIFLDRGGLPTDRNFFPTAAEDFERNAMEAYDLREPDEEVRKEAEKISQETYEELLSPLPSEKPERKVPEGVITPDE